jgi:hypothetical protein
MKNAITVPYPQVINTINLELTKDNIEVLGEFNITKTEIEDQNQTQLRDGNIGIALLNENEINTIDYATLSVKDYLFRVCLFELYNQYPDADYYLYPIIEYSRYKTNDGKNNDKMINSLTIKGKAVRIKL